LKELNEYLDGDLDARTKSDLDDHLAWCHNCYVVCDTTKKTIQIYKNTEVYDCPTNCERGCKKRSRPSAKLRKGLGPQDA